MKKEILTILFLWCCVFGYSQKNQSIYPNFIGQDLNEIENNSDWKVLQNSSGDLNKDGLNDVALILESKDSIPEKRCSTCKLIKNKPRILIVLLNQHGNKKTIIQNNKFIARGDEGGMVPYLVPELSIKNGVLTIFYQFTRSNQSYTFEFKNNQMVIISAESGGVAPVSGNFESDKYDFQKGEIISKTGNISNEKTKTQRVKINIAPKSLSDFGAMYDWEVSKNKYL